MKKFYSAVLLFLMINAGDITAKNIPPGNSLIEYTGRIDFTNPDAPQFSYPGISIRAAFKGTEISFILNDEKGANYFYIIIDGKILPKLNTLEGIHSYTPVSGLKDEIHELEIFRLTEEEFGKTSFLGFIMGEGNFLVPLKNKRERLIEFIGNSITCGYGNEGTLDDKFGPSTENQYLTYAAYAARAFNARQIAAAKSGIGVYRNYDGPVEGNKNCFSNNYSRVYFSDDSPLYSFSDKPDLVCIDLGTNDFSTEKGDSARYVTAMRRLIDTIQIHYNKPDILLLLGPMLWGKDLITVRNSLTFLAEDITTKGKGNVYFFEMSQQTGDLGMGIDYHPTVKQHLKNADELISFISKLKGWEPQNTGQGIGSMESEKQ